MQRKALAQERRRFGYRRLHVLLRREGHAVNRKRVQRLYREERLTNAGHNPWLEQPRAFKAALLGYLKEKGL